METPPARRRKAILRVYQCNMSALMVFSECEWSLIVAPNGAVIRTHIAGREIEAVMRAREIPENEKPEVFQTVRLMQRAAAPLINQSQTNA
jgi:hypothetical protein